MKNIIVIVSAWFPVLLAAQSNVQQADKLLTRYTQQQKFSGVCLVALKGNVIFSKAYGVADKNHRHLNKVETEFRIGSLTKMFTSTLVLQLVERSKLKLNDPISKYLPLFENGDKITIRNLLSHTSGIRGMTAANSVTLKELVNGYKQDALAFAPGAKFEYSNFNYILLGRLLEIISGQPYHKLLKKRIFDKLGMHHTAMDFDGRLSASKAMGYRINETNHAVEDAPNENIAAAGSAGAMYSTAGDLFKWSVGIRRHTLLSDSTLKIAFTPVASNYGLGWISDTARGRNKIGHTGSVPGFMSDFIYFPEEELCIILLSNLQTVIDAHTSRALTAIFFNEPFVAEIAKTPIFLRDSLLEKHSGTYESNGDKMVVSFTTGKLFVLAPGGDMVELIPESINKFYIKGPEISIEFREEGNIPVMFIDMRGGMKFKKVD